MMLVFATISVVLVDVFFSALMIGIGFAAGWWLFYKSAPVKQDYAEQERVQAALEKIRTLASNVAHNVGEHTHRVKEISSELNNEVKNGDSANIDKVVLDTVTEMVEANNNLQSQLAEAEEKLQQQAEEILVHAADARTDQLTQLANRRVFDDELERRRAEWKRLQTPYSLLMIDVDHFKKFNDVHGHLAGDEVLRGVARVLTEAMREMDVVCRYGGEEFAIIMPSTVGEVSRVAAERARKAIEGASFLFKGTELKVTASIGLSQIIDVESNETLVRRSDEALYASKEAGRNQAHFHDGERSHPITGEQPKPNDSQSTSVSHEEAEENQETDSPAVSEPDERQVSTPTLNRLPGKEVFHGELQRRVSEGQRFKVPLSLMLVQVDNFKSYKNQFGGQVGDLILDTVAQYLEILLRDMDLIAIYSEGQLAVMLPGSCLEDTMRVSVRVRSAVSSIVIPMGDSKLQLSVSLGLVEMQPGDDTELLLERAGEALFASKAAGTNCAHLHNGKSCEPVSEAEAVSASSSNN